jgi:predicted MFS family arabinose efflux permease
MPCFTFLWAGSYNGGVASGCWSRRQPCGPAFSASLLFLPWFGLVIVALVHMLSGVTWAAIAVSGTMAVAMLAPKRLEGQALGLYNAIIGTAGIVGSLAGGYLAQAFGYTASFGTATLLMGLTAAWLWQLRGAVLAGAPHPGPAQRAERRG